MEKANMDIRNYAKAMGVRLWQVAERYGCNDGNLSRKLRRELPDIKKARLLEIIDTLAKEKEVEQDVENREAGA